MLPFRAASEIEPVYFPATSPADVIVIVKIALPPLITVTGADTASQPVPFDIVVVGDIVIFPAQAPITPTVKVCGAGFRPTSVVKIAGGTDGGCRVHTGCTVNVTGMTLGVTTGKFVTLSIAAMVTEPV
jgi:hypothetical protein